MNSFYLYRLYRHSKFAFVFIICFIVLYAICISKKMDMMFFPYNNMFSDTISANKMATTYFVKVNDKKIPYTYFMYWKKDFSEEVLTNYSFYIKNNNCNYLASYIDQKVINTEKSKWLKNYLLPKPFSFLQWAEWYASFTNIATTQNQHFELMEYKIKFSENMPFVLDSTTISSTINLK